MLSDLCLVPSRRMQAWTCCLTCALCPQQENGDVLSDLCPVFKQENGDVLSDLCLVVVFPAGER